MVHFNKTKKAMPILQGLSTDIHDGLPRQSYGNDFVHVALLLLFSTQQTLLTELHDEGEESHSVENVAMENSMLSMGLEFDGVAVAALHTSRLFNTFTLLEEDLGSWVKQRSTAWFSCFLQSL